MDVVLMNTLNTIFKVVYQATLPSMTDGVTKFLKTKHKKMVLLIPMRWIATIQEMHGMEAIRMERWLPLEVMPIRLR